MMKKISSIKLDKKKIIILSSTLCVVLVSVLLFVLLGNKSDDNSISNEVIGISHKSGYAYDTIKAIEEDYYQSHTKSDITYKMYGEIGWRNFNCMKEEDKYYISVGYGCNETQYKYPENCEDVDYDLIEKQGHKLTSEPYIVKNHFIVSMGEAYDSKGSYHMEGAVDGYGTFVLSAYADLPEGTLISISSKTHEFQVNIYDKETRVVMPSGAMYFRVPDLKGRLLTVQVGNKIFKTSGNSEFLVYSYNIDYAISDEEEKLVAFLKDIEASKVIKNIEQKEVYSNMGAQIAGFVPVSGELTMLTRGTTKEDKISKEYRFIYYEKNYKYSYPNNPEYIDVSGNETLQITYEYLSIGKEFDTPDSMSGISDDYYGLLQDQGNLNKTEYGFGNVINGTNKNIDGIMKKYVPDFLEYSLNIIRDYNFQRASTSKCGSDFLDALDNCGCRDGWYHIKGKGCCPNGTTYDEDSNTCIKQGTTTIVIRCPSGTHDVGSNLCCLDGYDLSSDKKYCINKTTNKKSTPSNTGGSSSGGAVTLSGTYVQNISNVIATGPCNCTNQVGKTPHTILFQNGIAYFDKDRGGNSFKYEIQGNIIYGIDSNGIKHDDGWRLNGNTITIGDGKAKAVCTSSGGSLPNLCGFPGDGTYVKQ